jgi:16S rRNA (cytidine1402-2'-O)-methyltransferase
MAAVLGEDREATVARELTKLYETCVRGRLSELVADPRLQAPKGEIVVLVGAGREAAASADDADRALAEALSRAGPSEAAAEVAKALGLPKRELYRRALALKAGG